MNHTYAVSDLHGQYDLWEQVKQFVDCGDTLYILGDCADRGHDGWKIMVEALDMPNVKYLKGNHEDMLVRAMRAYKNCPEDERPWFFEWDHDYRLCNHNGGKITFSDWLHKGKGSMTWATKLNGLAEYAAYHNKNEQFILLSHAGFTPGMAEQDFLWDREHFLDEWKIHQDNVIVVHGHTPIPYLMEELGLHEETKPGMFTYCDGHKIDIDCGAHFTGCTTILDLDSLEQHILYSNKWCAYNKTE